MKILVTGSNGMLGQKIIYGLLGDPLCRIPDDIQKKIKSEVQIIACARGENRLKRKDGYIYEKLDITNKSEIEKIFSKYKPDVVINTAGMTNVDACETKREEAMLANTTAGQYMVDVLEKFGAHFIHLSTDFIFDGMKGSEYDETDKPNPLHYYAFTKLESEKIVMASKLKWSIIRTIIIFGTVDDRTRSNLILWVKNNLEQKKKINVITDQFRSPTLSEDLAQGCILTAMKGAEGIFHISGIETKSILELAYEVADFWKLDKSFINPVSSEELNQPAKRPPRTGFILDKAKKVLGYNPHSFREGLEIIDRQLKVK
ncbi:MAG: SDR family oxidoreductase [Bacteroidetes bacterium]|nr:SDR family oxidoreductase [Bacteroidota bacterium]